MHYVSAELTDLQWPQFRFWPRSLLVWAPLASWAPLLPAWSYCLDPRRIFWLRMSVRLPSTDLEWVEALILPRPEWKRCSDIQQNTLGLTNLFKSAFNLFRNNFARNSNFFNLYRKLFFTCTLCWEFGRLLFEMKAVYLNVCHTLWLWEKAMFVETFELILNSTPFARPTQHHLCQQRLEMRL